MEEGKWRALKASRRGPRLSHLFFADDLLFFSEAKNDQIAYIKEGLELLASGQTVNFHKSKMLCSPCVSDQDAIRTSTSLEIPLTKELGKYLGHRLIHHGNNCDAHKELMQRISNRLEGWKMKCLSRTRHLTLVQSVISSIPMFHMQLEKLPSRMHKDLDNVDRRCVWSKKDGNRGTHLLNWGTLIKTKKLGGANLGSAKAMNMALLAKFGWWVLICPGKLWCKVIRSKYGVHEEDKAHWKDRQRSSHIWKGDTLGFWASLKGTEIRSQ